jgi:Domain of Unknown Function with PDB structure (DUF3857)/Transglutaminase-like superfamily
MSSSLHIKLIFLCVLTVAATGRVSSQQLDLAPITDSLRKDAAAVKRSDLTEIEIASPRKARLHYHRVVTILNSSGDVFANVVAYYDKFHKLNSATATMYDATGKELKKIRKNEMEDMVMEGSGTVMSDTRIKTYRFVSHNYPYTVSYEEETDLEGFFILPQWLPQSLSSLAVEDSRLVVTAPASYALRYKEYHYPGKVIASENNGVKSYIWDIHNRCAARPEPLSPSWLHLEPCVKLAPGNFEIQGYKGSLYTWNDMGDFINALWRGRDMLPDEAKKKIHTLVDGLKDDHEKITVLYDFLQKNSHYVNIQLGIGGWQPFDAASVYKNRYGDCKALSNYMVALLKEAGIPAASVLIKAGSSDPDMDTAFVSSQFNHVIVLARAGADSVWLECTSQTLAPGYLGNFTDDRDALLIASTGGAIVHTPVYGLAENRLERTVRGKIDSGGNLIAIVETRYAGLQQDGLHASLDRYTKKDLLDQRRQMLGLTNCTIENLTYRQTGEKIPVIEETMQLNAENFATLTGSRLFITPGVFLKKVIRLPESAQPRKNDIEFATSFQEKDSLMLAIPPGYTPEKPLGSRHYHYPFGSFNFHSELRDDSTLLITCHYQQLKGHYPAENYPKLIQLFNLIHRENIDELVLVKKQ